MRVIHVTSTLTAIGWCAKILSGSMALAASTAFAREVTPARGCLPLSAHAAVESLPVGRGRRVHVRAVVRSAPSEIALAAVRDTAAQLYPQALRTTQDHDGITIALVYDGECRLVQHAIGRRDTDTLTVAGGIATLVPNADTAVIRSGGLMALRPTSLRGPWVVWAVIPTASAHEP